MTHPATLDPYRSRVTRDVAPLPRQDPVLHGGVDRAGPLCKAHLERFERAGFLLVENVFSDAEVRELRRAFSEFFHSAVPDDERVIRETTSDAVRSIFAVHDTDSVFARVCADPRLAGVAAQILADHVYVHQSRINAKPALRGRGFYWHSDFETWHVEDGLPRMRAISASIALTENTPWNGPLMVIPGSHRSFVPCVGPTPPDHYRRSLREQQIGVPDDESLRRAVESSAIVAPPARAGSVVFFDCNLLHASSENLSTTPRQNLFYVFNACSNAPTSQRFSDALPRPTFVATRDARPIVIDERPGAWIS